MSISLKEVDARSKTSLFYSPNFSNFQGISSGFIVPKPGFIISTAFTATVMHTNLWINNTLISNQINNAGNAYYTNSNIVCPVTTNDRVTYNGHHGSDNTWYSPAVSTTLTKYYFVRNNIYYIGEQMLKYWLHLREFLLTGGDNMSISLNNHETRIKNLENNAGYYKEVVLIKSNNLDRQVTLPQSISNFKTFRVLHLFNANNDQSDMECCTYYVSDLKKYGTVGISVPDGNGTIKYINDTTLELHGGKHGFIRDIIGITWGGGIKSRIRNIILSFFRKLSKGGSI